MAELLENLLVPIRVEAVFVSASAALGASPPLNKPGVHLHWILPPALTRGVVGDDGPDYYSFYRRK